MIDHTGVAVSDFEKSKAFYRAALQPIGYELLLEFPAEVTGHADVAGFGEPPRPDFWINRGSPNKPAVHIAFRVRSRALVEAFHSTAIAAGGRSNGAPGLRPHYHANYYGAFVLDPDDHNIEVVCHEPTPAQQGATHASHGTVPGRDVPGSTASRRRLRSRRCK